jgi:tyrosyl-tRNA synthetase
LEKPKRSEGFYDISGSLLRLADNNTMGKKKRNWKCTDPSDKAKITQGIKMIGRISLKQYLFLISKGYDADTISKWTKYHASKEIGKLIERFKNGD